ncbi:transketolase [Candidatus Pacearchaeota archaeon]|nr:MAG: transketolase [Candidatus Pacearchaeota archaeon]
MQREEWIKFFRKKAWSFRKKIIQIIGNAGSGHPGGSLSVIDLLTVLYYYKLRYDPKNPDWEERDRVVLSKGHTCPALYVILADLGVIPEDWLWNLRKVDYPLQGHPARRTTPGIETSTGSLGQGFSVAVGMALGLKYIEKSEARVYAIIGDGEIQEGIVWEAAMFAGNKKLDNLIVILDNNTFQLDDRIYNINDPEPLKDKFEAFKWEVLEINGHDYAQIMDALDWAYSRRNGKPKLIKARTIKGKGVSFMENNNKFHGKAPTKEQVKQALKEIEEIVK